MIDTKLLQQLYPEKTNQYNKILQEAPVFVLPIVTQQDAENGFITRYFARSSNDSSFITEIDKKQFTSLQNNPRFVTAELRWKIVGKKTTFQLPSGAIVYGIADVNRQTVSNADLTFGGLRNYIVDYEQFWLGETIPK